MSEEQEDLDKRLLALEIWREETDRLLESYREAFMQVQNLLPVDLPIRRPEK